MKHYKKYLCDQCNQQQVSFGKLKWLEIETNVQTNISFHKKIKELYLLGRNDLGLLHLIKITHKKWKWVFEHSKWYNET